jgi:hypothetical protein
VTGLHRTHGVFGAHARPDAMIWPGDATRLAVVAAGALVFFLLGVVVAALA